MQAQKTYLTDHVQETINAYTRTVNKLGRSIHSLDSITLYTITCIDNDLNFAVLLALSLPHIFDSFLTYYNYNNDNPDVMSSGPPAVRLLGKFVNLHVGLHA